MKCFFVFLKILLLLVVLFVAFRYWSGNERFTADFLHRLTSVFTNPAHLWAWLGLLVLTLTNWLLEAFKWRQLVRAFYPISLWASLRSILIGVSFSFVGFSHIGHYAGRAYALPAAARVPALGSLLVANYPQALSAYTFGCIAMCYWVYGYQGFDTLYGLLGLLATAIALTVGLVLYFKFDYLHEGMLRLLQSLPTRLQSWGGVVWLDTVMQQLSYGDNPTKTVVLVASLVRYLLFVGQFAVMLLLFDVGLPIHELLTGVMLVYLVKSVVPNVSFLSDLGIREISAYYFLGSMGASETAVLGATLTVWGYNLLLPACVGALWNLLYEHQHKV